MKKRVVEFVVGAILLTAVAFGIGSCASALPRVNGALSATSSLLDQVCVDGGEKCDRAQALYAVAKRAYDRAVAADLAGAPDAGALVDQAAAAIQDLMKAVKAL
jgi:hypothetical protein